MEGVLTRLRGVEESDAPLLHAWDNDPEIRAALDVVFPVTISSTTEYIREITGSRDGVLFIVSDRETEAPIGFTTLFDIDWIARKAEFGIIIGDKRYWSRGYGTDAALATLSFAFEDLGLHRVYLSTYSYHPRAIRVCEKCGFVREGVMRKARYHHGAYHDVVLMGILYDEFAAHRGRPP